MLLYLMPLIECLCCPGFNYLQHKKKNRPLVGSSTSIGEPAKTCSIILSSAANVPPTNPLNLCVALIAVVLGMHGAM